jgi:hypothetical protein
LPIPESYRICADGYLSSCAPVVARKFIMVKAALGCYRMHHNNNYSKLNRFGSAVSMKNESEYSIYRKLVYYDLIRLAEKYDKSNSVLSSEFKVICLANELYYKKKCSGVLPAIYYLWKSRSVMVELPLMLRVFRIITIIMKLVLASEIYTALQNLYAAIELNPLVQIYIRKDKRYRYGTY